MGFDFSDAADLTPDPLNYFSERGDDYERYRPRYPAAAIDAMVSDLTPLTRATAVDVGAGTGIGSRLLADRGLEVIALEPNTDMRTAAPPHERVRVMAGTAEALPLESASVDLVTSFQAFHWFDFTQSLREFRRVLKPDGRLALVWSLWDPQDRVSREYTRLVMIASPAQSGPKPPVPWTARFKKIRYQLFWAGLWLPGFRNLQRTEFRFSQQLDLAGLVGLARSQGFTPAAGPELERLAAALSAFHQRFCNAQGQVRLCYCTRLYLATASSQQTCVLAGDAALD